MMFDLPPFDKAPAIVRPAPDGYRRNRSGLIVRKAMLPGMYGPIGFIGGNAPAVPTYQDAHFDNSNATSFSFSFTLPTPAFSGRWLIIAVAGYSTNSSRTVSSVSVFGSAATLIPGCRAQNTSTSGVVEFWAIQLNSGVSGTVTVVFSGSMSGGAAQVFSVSGLQSITPTSTPAGSTAAPAAATLNIGAGGFGLGFAYSGGVTNPTATWSGLTLAATTSFVSSSVGAMSSGLLASNSGNSSLSASCTWSSTTSAGRCGLFATFR